MSDIIETIDRQHAEYHKALRFLTGDLFAKEVALFNTFRHNWPALRDRLRDAERRLANNYGPNGVVIRDLVTAGHEIVRLQNALAEAERKSRAFDAIESGVVGLVGPVDDAGGRTWKWSVDREEWAGKRDMILTDDLLTAIEQATREAKP